MFKEQDKYGQYQIDCRLSGERSLEENVAAIIDFGTQIRKEEVGDVQVKNRHEGYGFLADAHQGVIRAVKAVKDGITDLLNALPQDDAQAVDKVEGVAAALEDAIKATIEMAAEAKRVSSDLFSESWNSTPLEEYLGDNDGFEEPEKED